MAEAGAAALGGLRLKTDVDVVRYPDRYMDERGGDTWESVLELLVLEEGLCA
jgi:DNA polymerase-1